MSKVEYVLTLNSAQAHEILVATELLMRLKLKQSFTFCDMVGGWGKVDSKDYREAESHLDSALEALFRNRKDSEYKDDEWYRLYNIYQVVRKAIHDAEHPEGIGVDSYTPLQFTKEPLPEIKWEKNDCYSGTYGLENAPKMDTQQKY